MIVYVQPRPCSPHLSRKPLNRPPRGVRTCPICSPRRPPLLTRRRADGSPAGETFRPAADSCEHRCTHATCKPGTGDTGDPSIHAETAWMLGRNGPAWTRTILSSPRIRSASFRSALFGSSGEVTIPCSAPAARTADSFASAASPHAPSSPCYSGGVQAFEGASGRGRHGQVPGLVRADHSPHLRHGMTPRTTFFFQRSRSAR